MAEPDKNAPESVTVTCPTCHERIAVRLTEGPQSVRCTYCKAPVSVPSREQVRTQQSVKTNYPAPTVEEYAIAAPEDVAQAKPAQTKPAGKSAKVDPASITLECPTCHELVKATVGAKPSRVPCTFCAAPLSVPDRRTLASRREKKIEPPSAAEVGDYAAGPMLEVQAMRRGTVFDRLAEVRQEVIPPPPQWTFFSGVFLLPWRKDAVARWVYLSLGFTAIICIGLVVKSLPSPLVAVFFLLPIIWIGFLTFSYAAACGLCVLEATAGGLDRIEGWPEPNWKEWMAHLMYVGWIGAIPLGVSYGLGMLAKINGIPLILSMPAAFFVIYPISLMSALEANSIWVPLTTSIMGSLVKWWWCWLMFYLLSGLMAWGLVAVAVFAVGSSNDVVFVALGPLLAAAVLIYSRLVGRLGWRMTTIHSKCSPGSSCGSSRIPGVRGIQALVCQLSAVCLAGKKSGSLKRK